MREIEPYVVSQSTHAKASPKHGVSRVPWLSGAATWTYFAITQYVLGIRPEVAGLRIDPCIPGSWKGFSVERRFRDHAVTITVKNEAGVERGVARMSLNGQPLEGNLLPVEKLEATNEVEVWLGEGA